MTFTRLTRFSNMLRSRFRTVWSTPSILSLTLTPFFVPCMCMSLAFLLMASRQMAFIMFTTGASLFMFSRRKLPSSVLLPPESFFAKLSTNMPMNSANSGSLTTTPLISLGACASLRTSILSLKLSETATETSFSVSPSFTHRELFMNWSVYCPSTLR